MDNAMVVHTYFLLTLYCYSDVEFKAIDCED